MGFRPALRTLPTLRKIVSRPYTLIVRYWTNNSDYLAKVRVLARLNRLPGLEHPHRLSWLPFRASGLKTYLCGRHALCPIAGALCTKPS